MLRFLAPYPSSSFCFLSVTDINLNSPDKGLLSDAMTDVPVENASAAAAPPRTSAYNGLTEAEEEELRSELAKVKEDF